MKKFFVVAVFSLFLLIFFHFTAEKTTGTHESSPLFTEKIQKAMEVIKQNYISEPPAEKLLEGTLKGMLKSLDEGSEYMTSLEYEQLEIEARGDYVGVGITLSKNDPKDPSGSYPIVLRVSKDSPAGRSGVQPGDEVRAIKGQDTKLLNLEAVIRLLHGPLGTPVKLLIARGSDSSPAQERALDLVREKISMETLGEASFVIASTGYIQCLDFSDKTPELLQKEIERLQAAGLQGLILDLRGNTGGILESAIAVAELFLEKDRLVISTRGRTPDDTQKFQTAVGGPFADLPIVLLVDKGTASAAEILAGALQGNKRALLVGEKTYGKASIQSIFPLPDGSALRLTTAFYYTPDGKLIQGKGIEPDIKVESLSPKSSAPLKVRYTGRGKGKSATNDPVFQKAAELLKA
jgi:carboxyl-terminal processing protease